MTWAALIIWPIIAVILFNKLRLPVALLVTIIGGYLLLPTQTAFDLPGLPPLDKNTVPALVALLFVLFHSREQRLPHLPHQGPDVWPTLPGILPRDPVVLGLFLMLFIGQLGTHAMNRDPLVYGPLILPGLRPYDAMSAMLTSFMLFVPFLLARKVLSSVEGQRLLLVAIVIAATAYSFLALYEVRMSPQLNRMLYGFFPHDWSQHRRGGGWRPIVFMNHGLHLGIFLAVAVVSAAALTRVDATKNRLIWFWITVWLFGTLFLAKVLGAFLIAIVVLGALFLLPKRLQITFVFAVTVCILVYPVVRAANVLPFEQLLSYVNSERAASLAFRLENEQLLLEKANERPAFGWGGWGRSRVYTEWGRDISVPDGAWIIWLGLGGWLKYIATFGLLSWGILRLFWQRGGEIDGVTVALALALTANLVDLIPNTGVSPVTWLLAGALCGRLERPTEALHPETAAAQPGDPHKRRMVYAREHIKSAYAPDMAASQQSTADREALPYRRDLGKAKRT